MIRYALSLVACGSLVALVACSSDDAGERYPSSDAFCGAKADEECAAVAEACGTTKDRCKSFRVDECNKLAGAATGEGRTYRAGNAEACINKTKELYAARAINADKEKEQIEVCDRVFAGTKKSGEACVKSTDCEGELTCSNQVCFKKTEKAQGEPCANPGDVCAKGTYCGNQGATKFCLPKNGLGEICTADAPCKEDLRCVNSCVAKLEAGSSCDTGDDCTTGYCDTGTKKCAGKSFASGTALCATYGG